MSKVIRIGLAFVLVVVGTALVPGQVLANGGRGSGGHGGNGSHGHNRLHSTPPKHFDAPHRFFGNKHGNFGHGNFGHGHVWRGTPNYWGYGSGYVVSSPSIIYTPPPTPVYVPSPPAYAPPVPPPVSSLPAPTETVIEFPTGRYELRGDGINTPYRWVWVPNAPDAPPSGAAPASAPRAAPEPTRPIEVFRWVDETGAVHLTDRLDKVPEAYRAKVTKSQS